jgi:hypothetical protein
VPVSEVQVVLDGRGVEERVLAASVTSLLRDVGQVELAHLEPEAMNALRARFAGGVAEAGSLRPGVPLLVSPGRVAFASGAVRRMVRHTSVPGRSVTRVLVAGLGDTEYPACWSASWLRLYQGSLLSLVDADLSFDRAHLSARSPKARSWLTAERVGLALVGDQPESLTRWARRTGWSLDAQQAWASIVRGPAGEARRRMARRRHRRRASSVARAGR